MVFRALAKATSALALLATTTQGFNVYVLNRCNTDIQLAHVTLKRGNQVETLGVGKTLVRSVPLGEPSHVFKAGRGTQATLGEFSAVGGSWFDISIIPTGPKSGPDYCPSLQACKDHTGGVGFNMPMQISPRTPSGDRCRPLTCMADGCPDAYHFPKDDTKTHHCPPNTDFDLTFCPGGTGGLPTPTPTPMPMPTPTPTPTLAPTVTPTLTPTPTETPAPTTALPNEGSASLEDVKGRTSLSEVAGEADVIDLGTVAPVVDAGSPPVNSVNEVTTRSSAESGTSSEVYILSILGGAGCVAVAAIVVVRKKKNELDELNMKTPRGRATTSGAAMSILITPESEVTVL